MHIDFSVAINTHLKTISLNPQKFNLTSVTFIKASFEKTKEQLRRVVLVWGKGEGEGGLLGAILCTIPLPFLFAKGGYRNCKNRKDLLKRNNLIPTKNHNFWYEINFGIDKSQLVSIKQVQIM